MCFLLIAFFAEGQDEGELTLGQRIELLQRKELGNTVVEGPEKKTKMSADSLAVLLSQAVRRYRTQDVYNVVRILCR